MKKSSKSKSYSKKSTMWMLFFGVITIISSITRNIGLGNIGSMPYYLRYGDLIIGVILIISSSIVLIVAKYKD